MNTNRRAVTWSDGATRSNGTREGGVESRGTWAPRSARVWRMSDLTWVGTAKPYSRGEILRQESGLENIGNHALLMITLLWTRFSSRQRSLQIPLEIRIKVTAAMTNRRAGSTFFTLYKSTAIYPRSVDEILKGVWVHDAVSTFMGSKVHLNGTRNPQVYWIHPLNVTFCNNRQQLGNNVFSVYLCFNFSSC